MRHDQQLVEISRLVLDITAMDGLDNDLDSLLEKLLLKFENLPDFQVLSRGAIRMYTPRNRLLTVAQHGYRPLWMDLSVDAQFAEIPQQSGHTASIASTSETDRFLLLPLTGNSQPLGQVLLCISSDWTPDNTQIAFMTDLARALSGLVARCIINETLKVREIELEEARTQAIHRLGTASEYRDCETGMHIMRMSSIAVAIGKAMPLPDDQIEQLIITAPMHDVGKIGIADAILLKAGKLSDDEFEKMKTHTEIGERLLHGSDELIETARSIAASHHENWDGTGYPRGFKGDQIPVMARICAIADVLDALTSKRTYKDAWPADEAVDWIIAQSGKKFDPEAVMAFERALPQILRILELYREDIINPSQALNLPELKHTGHTWVTWDPSLDIGIEVIDEHHRYLFGLVNDLIDVMAKKLGVRQVARIIKSLGQYAQIHFRAEERMMEHYGFDGLERQQVQHQQFHSKLKEFSMELHANPLIAQFEIANFLREWLVSHIRFEDAKLRSLIR